MTTHMRRYGAVYTACGMHVSKTGEYYTRDRKEVTCSECRKEIGWSKWDKKAGEGK
jgi:hypothetical protein